MLLQATGILPVKIVYITHREGGRSPRSPREGRKGSTDERVLDEEELGDRRTSLLR